MSRNSVGRFTFEDEGRVLLDRLEGARYVRADSVNFALDKVAEILDANGISEKFPVMMLAIEALKEPEL